MPSVKKIFYTKKIYTDGTSPVIIQIISGKKIKRKVIFSILPEQWDAKEKQIKLRKHPDYEKLNADLDDEYNRLKKLIRDNPWIDIENIFNKKTEQGSLDFSGIVELYLKKIIVKSGSTYFSSNSILNKFANTLPSGIYLNKITFTNLQLWINKMVTDKNKESTIHANVKVVKHVNSFAVKNGLDKGCEAINNLKVSVGQRNYKERLTPAELQAFKDVVLPEGSKLSEIRDMFLFSIYLRGMRISDIVQMKQSYLVGNRVHYISEKTNKHFNIKLIPEAIEIVNRYKDDREYLFSFFRWSYNNSKTADQNEMDRVNIIKTITANINGKLNKISEKAKINKKISTHIARHTFARMALEKINDTNITMDLLGHSSMKVHEAYIREISKTKDLDDAADNIFN